MISKEATEIANAFTKYAKTGDRSLIEKYTRKQIEMTLLQYHMDSGWPHYKAMEKRMEEIKEEEKNAKDERKQGRHEIEETKRHSQALRVSIVSVILVAGGIIWGIIYNLWIYPPKYDLSHSSL